MGKDWNASSDDYTAGYGPKPDIQRQIDAAMRGVIADSRYNPNSLSSGSSVRVVGAVEATELPQPRGTGWREPAPLASPPGQDAIERLTNAALPHGPEHGRKGGAG
jgi:hypothetical protein